MWSNLVVKKILVPAPGTCIITWSKSCPSDFWKMVSQQTYWAKRARGVWFLVVLAPCIAGILKEVCGCQPFFFLISVNHFTYSKWTAWKLSGILPLATLLDKKLSPFSPFCPFSPMGPANPEGPGAPVAPGLPGDPGNPAIPGGPRTPFNPGSPGWPFGPWISFPRSPFTPFFPGAPGKPGPPGKPRPPGRPGSPGRPGGPAGPVSPFWPVPSWPPPEP